MMDDLISRKALLNVVGKIPQSWEYGQAISDVYEIIKSAPTLTLDDLRPKGRWKDGECTNCGCDALYHKGVPAPTYTEFCPNCGADMRGGEG